jgi:hypothetical protein
MGSESETLRRGEIADTQRALRPELGILNTKIPDLPDSDYRRVRSDGFLSWWNGLRVKTHAHAWEEFILNKDIDVPDESTWTYKTKLDYANAYDLLLTKCSKHQINYKLEKVKPGDTRAVLDALFAFHFRTDGEAKRSAMNDFNTMSMDRLDLNVNEFIQAVEIRSDTLRAIGCVVSDEDKTAALLQGLLLEFEPIKAMIDN